MTSADVMWGGLLAVGAVLETRALRNRKPGDTLSETTRRWFHVRSRAGRITFAVSWVLFAIWYLIHILG